MCLCVCEGENRKRKKILDTVLCILRRSIVRKNNTNNKQNIYGACIFFSCGVKNLTSFYTAVSYVYFYFCFTVCIGPVYTIFPLISLYVLDQCRVYQYYFLFIHFFLFFFGGGLQKWSNHLDRLLRSEQAARKGGVHLSGPARRPSGKGHSSKKLTSVLQFILFVSSITIVFVGALQGEGEGGTENSVVIPGCDLM